MTSRDERRRADPVRDVRDGGVSFVIELAVVVVGAGFAVLVAVVVLALS